MALPKIRQPLSSIIDKGIPFNVNDPKELIELRRWCRLFYSTHDLVPLLVDIYSKFPVTGLEFQSKDPLIERFYTEMFLDDLNYEEFLPDAILREYFVAGEVTTLAHFNESLGIWSSEEVLNPDMVAVSKSLFVDEERVQLLVKDLVETLRMGPEGQPESQERPSERLERNWEYQQLVKHYPEIIQAAARDDGLDIADALVSRLVNKASPWDNRGTPPLLRSFRTLLMEEELNAAQDAVAGRLYAPMILATMGIENMGNDEPWIPSQGELDDLRDDLQSALAADFKLLVHNFGVKIESVFGRESVPDFGPDYDRIDAKLMQAWGIGQALIMGGTGAGGAYASSALNREVCEQLMMGAQRKVIRHMRKRMEVIAEAQEHYDYDLKGGLRVPLYREIVEEDEYTGEQRIVRVPKLLVPEIHFATLNLRDENQERMFVTQLKQMGVPISDKALAINIQVDFAQELEREAKETVDKGMAKAQAFKKLQDLCDAQEPAVPTRAVRAPAGHPAAADHAGPDHHDRGPDQADGTADGPDVPGGHGRCAAGHSGPDRAHAPARRPPARGWGGWRPAVLPADVLGPLRCADGGPLGDGRRRCRDGCRAAAQPPAPTRVRRDAGRFSPCCRQARPRPPAGPSASTATSAKSPMPGGPRLPTKFELGPSSVGRSRHASEDQVAAAIQRRELYARHRGTPLVSQLVRDSDFYRMLNAGHLRGQIQADWPEIRAGGAAESRKLLADLIDHYEDVSGVSPVWD